MSILVELPWPPKQLSPNFKRRKHWSAYRPHVKAYRETCWVHVMHALGRAPRDGLTLASVTFYPPDHRRRDADGMIGSIKAGIDGIADALNRDDHGFRPTYHFAEPVPSGKVVIVIGEG